MEVGQVGLRGAGRCSYEHPRPLGNVIERLLHGFTTRTSANSMYERRRLCSLKVSSRSPTRISSGPTATGRSAERKSSTSCGDSWGNIDKNANWSGHGLRLFGWRNIVVA